MLRRTRLTHFSLQEHLAITPQLQGHCLIKMHKPHTKCAWPWLQLQVSINMANLSLCFSNPVLMCPFSFSLPTPIAGFPPWNQSEEHKHLLILLLRLVNHTDKAWLFEQPACQQGHNGRAAPVMQQHPCSCAKAPTALQTHSQAAPREAGTASPHTATRNPHAPKGHLQ